MRQILLFLIFFVAILIAHAQLPAKHHADPSLTASCFDEYIKRSLQSWKTPGLSVAVVQNGKEVFKKAYGVRELGKPDPYTTSTLSTCASTTKAMTAVCMGMLVDEGKVKWTDPVVDILPEFKLRDPATTAQITVRDLFTHNTGLGNADMLWELGYSRMEILHRMQFVPLTYSLRAGFIYQNLMYLVAGEIILKLTGKTWDEFITDRLFLPLHMTNTYADYSKTPQSARTSLHFRDRDTIKVIKYLDEDNIGPAGGVFSCADDMVKWMQFLQDSSAIDGKPLLKPETFSELFKPQSFVTDAEFYPTSRLTHPHWKTYGLGWFQQDYRGQMVQFHTGSLNGLVAIHGMIPSSRFNIYIFGNLDHSEIRHALMFKAFDLWCFGDTTNNWSDRFLALYKSLEDSARKKESDFESKRIRGTHLSLPIENYTGRYTSDLYGSVDIVTSGDSLAIKAPGNYSLTLGHWHSDMFRGHFSYWWFGTEMVQFQIAPEGIISGFLMNGSIYRKEKS